MIDILYSIGPNGGARGDNTELRWSLRSLALYGRNVGRVVVAGYPPDWLSDEVVKLPVGKPEGCGKNAAIWHAVMTAIDAGAMSGEFLYSSDDHFLVAPFDADAVPFYRRSGNGGEIPTEAKARGGVSNRRMLGQTRDALLKAGFGVVRSNTHKHTRLHAQDAAEAARVASLAPCPALGVELTCVFQNVRAAREKIEWTDTRDWKMRAFAPEAVASGQFSCADSAFSDPKFISYMEAQYAQPCRYEKT